MRTAYFFRGQLSYANRACDETNKRPIESPIRAVVRSLNRRLGADVQLWWAGQQSTDETYRAQWFDPSTQRYCAEIVKLESVR